MDHRGTDMAPRVFERRIPTRIFVGCRYHVFPEAKVKATYVRSQSELGKLCFDDVGCSGSRVGPLQKCVFMQPPPQLHNAMRTKVKRSMHVRVCGLGWPSTMLRLNCQCFTPYCFANIFSFGLRFKRFFYCYGLEEFPYEGDLLSATMRSSNYADAARLFIHFP